ncbi:MAG: Dam family site-specific DNA-(adenine-N6)-methyltransferase [Lachnospiraceae bacterium]|nr:Dam family site-specific DNA-(adenine-N6)-methyltransferase [Lachnospiraceae bacterium]
MNYIKSPLNYTGGKHKILSPIFELFPTKINTFVDLFAGGFNVGINVEADTIICNDQITYLIRLYEYFASQDTNEIIREIKERIGEFELSLQNVEGYNALRDRYNETKDIIDFFVLTCYSFNHQIRFNNSQKFNSPFGKDRSCYNASIENNLIQFCEALKRKNIKFFNQDFLSLDLSGLGTDDLVYCDPPYLISTGSYNDGNRGFKDWTEEEEKQLLGLLDGLNERDVKFALSNVLYHKGLANDLLIEWGESYQVHYIDKTYANCSYHFKEREAKTVEVLITNY